MTVDLKKHLHVLGNRASNSDNNKISFACLPCIVRRDSSAGARSVISEDGCVA